MGGFLRPEIAARRTCLAAGPNFLRAFQQLFDVVRVLIVGQDPYPTPRGTRNVADVAQILTVVDGVPPVAGRTGRRSTPARASQHHGPGKPVP
ncbi:hypothetical protein GCM10023084_35350 [Streptomyces lacrimifluminis]|uniref:Uracil-DNA glycosylase n=1 Tax=Streptomyces lacrimifluminis TaxID=1500077 RepID=A0A917NX98_9ACTN|nr:hypothetical protein GCM10012282_38610 [Streptomyces lacrimifluminis]